VAAGGEKRKAKAGRAEGGTEVQEVLEEVSISEISNAESAQEVAAPFMHTGWHELDNQPMCPKEGPSGGADTEWQPAAEHFGEEGQQLASSTMQGTVEFTNLVATWITDETTWGLKVCT